MYFIEPQSHKSPKNANCATFEYKGAEFGEVFFKNHNHIVLEVLAVKKGSMHLITSKSEYILRSGEVAVVNPFCLHYGESNGEPCEYICLTLNLRSWFSKFENEAFKVVQSVLEEKCCLKEFYSESNPLFTHLLEIERLFSCKEAAEECEFSAHIFSLLGVLLSDYKDISEEHLEARSADFMRNVECYLRKHYMENISTAHIAKEFFMTVPCFCYNFKHNFGISFLKYLSKYRINIAIDIYTQDKLSLNDLAEKVGFLDYNYFCRLFKKYIGVSPTKYFGLRK